MTQIHNPGNIKMMSKLFPWSFTMRSSYPSSHAHVGTSPPEYHQEWVTHTIHYHGFESLSTVRGAFVASPIFCSWGINGV
jgi:hypothetical protein